MAVAVGIIAASCYYDSEEYLYGKPGAACDTSNITYSGGVKPILDTYCLSCHNNSSAASLGGNIKLGDYASVYVQANNKSLYGAISHAGGYSAMPKGAAKMDDCKILVIKKWIDAGMLNN